MNNINRIDKRLALLDDGFTEIPGYSGYWAREDGSIASSINREVDMYRILKPANKNGYHVARVRINRKQCHPLWHRLIAITFIPNPENKPQINHKDGIKINNQSSNLEWVTGSENIIHALRTGLKIPFKTVSLRGETNPNVKFKKSDVLEMRAMYAEGVKRKDIEAKFGCHETTLGKILKRQTWTHI